MMRPYISVAKKMLYGLGALSAYHRLRNSVALTVVMFHRVLDPRDVRWQGSDPEWTVSQTFFAQCLDFFVEHYSVVALDDLLDSRRKPQPLPDSPLLITFDDGWSDTLHYAAPELERRGLSATLFVATGAVGMREGFWQERIRSVYQTGCISAQAAEKIWRCLFGDEDIPKCYDDLVIRRIITAVASLPSTSRVDILGHLPSSASRMPPQMLSETGLRELSGRGFALGTHGVSHEPFPMIHDLSAEMTESLRALRAWQGSHGGIAALSFPHGRYRAEDVTMGRRTGYDIMFTSDRGLHPLAGGLTSNLIPRVDIHCSGFVDSDGNLRPEALALWLFRQPHLRLTTTA